jgi:hypothetical protein
VVARLLAQWFIDRELPFAALDGDRSNPALLRYYADFAQHVELEQLDSADQILERALAEQCAVLVDLPAQSHRPLQRWFEETDVVRYAREAGVPLVFWHVTDGGFDSVSHLERQLEAVGGDVQFMVVENQGRSKDFSQFEASAARRRVLELGGQVVRLPELDAAVMYEIDRFGSSFWAAINRTEGERVLSPLQRRRAKTWLTRAYAALEPLLLGARPARADAPAAQAAAPNARTTPARTDAVASLDVNGFGAN